MKFTCDTASLKKACGTAKRAVSGKTSIPALECLLLRCQGSELEIAGYDLELCIKTRIEATVHDPGACLLDAALLHSILGKLDDETVTIDAGDRDKAKITAGGLVYKLNTMPAGDFPEVPCVDNMQRLERGAEADDQQITMPTTDLQRLIQGTAFSAAVSAESKPVHTGVLFEQEGAMLKLAAIDGFRLAVRSAESVEYTYELERLVVPQKALKELAGIKTKAEQVRICRHRRHVTFVIGDVTITSRLLDGEFMNYRAAIPAEWVMEMTADPAALLAAIKRVSLVLQEKIKAPLRMALSPTDGAITLSCISSIGEAQERVPVEGCTEAMEIGFNHRYLVDALNACTDDTVRLRVRSDVQPVVILPPQADDYLYMVLPVRLKASA